MSHASTIRKVALPVFIMDPERPGRCNVSVDEKQHDTITAAEGQQLAKLTINFLKSIRKNDKFRASIIVFCYTKVILILMHQFFSQKTAPQRLQMGLTDDNFHSTPRG